MTRYVESIANEQYLSFLVIVRSTFNVLRAAVFSIWYLVSGICTVDRTRRASCFVMGETAFETCGWNDRVRRGYVHGESQDRGV